MNKLNSMPPLYYYVAKLIAMYPFTSTAASYTSHWPEECRRKGSDPDLIEIAREAANDEKGHDRLILKDLKTLKIPIQIGLSRFRSASTQVLISRFKQSVAANHLHLLAWLLCVESRAVETCTAESLQKIQTMLGPWHQAMRFCRIHSAIGPEVEHVEKRKQWIAALPTPQKQIVMQEVDQVTHFLSCCQDFDLDCEEFDRFMTQHASHLVDHAWSVNLWRFYCGHKE